MPTPSGNLDVSCRIDPKTGHTTATVTRVDPDGSDGPGGVDIVVFALSTAGDLRGTYSPRALVESHHDRLVTDLAGTTLVVDARLAGLSADGLLDAGEGATPATIDGDTAWLGPGLVPFRVRLVAKQEADEAATTLGPWRERLRWSILRSPDGEPTRLLLVEKWMHESATEDDRSASRPQLLCDHHRQTEQRIRVLAGELGLEDRYVEMLALVARLHDEGKRATNWQRAFGAPRNGVYAKTRRLAQPALLGGYRHEFGSLLAAREHDEIRALDEDLRDLALHLVVAHHGHARPVIASRGCEALPPSALEPIEAEVALRFARLQRRWGPWGLAWWEALVRSADQFASRENDANDDAEVR